MDTRLPPIPCSTRHQPSRLARPNAHPPHGTVRAGHVTRVGRRWCGALTPTFAARALRKMVASACWKISLAKSSGTPSCETRELRSSPVELVGRVLSSQVKSARVARCTRGREDPPAPRPRQEPPASPP
eukprot:2653680-Prymnesium_polylepis.1